VARFFAGPLGELDRAVAAFGGGHVDVHVDEEKAGPYAPLAHTWNAMTARVQAARLRERELLVNVSHELRTPLARVRVAVELADEGVDDAAAVRAALADVDVDLAELEIMIDDVLTAARLESHALPPLKRASVDVDDVVAAAAERFALRHPRHTWVVQRAHGVVVGDALLLRRALLNVLDNAAKYSEARSRVTVHVDVDDAADGEVAIAVADEGVGIAAADQVRVFEPFFRVDKSRSRGAGGVGLGLAIVQGIVRAHGGTVWLTSAPGQGSTVTLRLPRAPLPSPR
jgi:signal transduction histidine kinase